MKWLFQRDINSCEGSPGDSVTHRDSTAQTDYNFIWTAPSTLESVTFHITALSGFGGQFFRVDQTMTASKKFIAAVLYPICVHTNVYYCLLTDNCSLSTNQRSSQLGK